MRKLFLSIASIAIVLTSCSKDSNLETQEEQNQEISDDFFARTSLEQCGTMAAKELALEKNPALRIDYDAVEEFTNRIIEEGSFNRLAADGSIIIPVVYHVIYRTSSENLPQSQLEDQIAAMNEDFNLNNPNRGDLPSEFQPVEANVGISFELQDVIRVNSNKRRWRPDDSMKFTSSGGSDVVNPEQYLNIWIVNSMPYRGGQILGYAQFPGGSRATDGVVLASNFVGRNQRTATHEVGHWLNLRHIWGDGGCSVDDFVADTPLSSQNYSNQCPTYPTASCGSNDMTMNFMSYVRDECMYMFSNGQKARMFSVFAQGGYREAMAQ